MENEILCKILENRGWWPKATGNGIIPEMALLNNVDVYKGDAKLMFIYGFGKTMNGMPAFGAPLPFNPALSAQSHVPFCIRTNEEVQANGHPNYLYKQRNAEGMWEYYYKIPSCIHFAVAVDRFGSRTFDKVTPEKALELSETTTGLVLVVTLEIEMNEMRYFAELPESDRYINVFNTYFGYLAEVGMSGSYGVPKLRSKAFNPEKIIPGEKSMCIEYVLDF